MSFQDDYHRWLYDTEVWTTVKYKGVPCQKFPMDLWIYQEIIWETHPFRIIEVGVADGGTSLFLTDLLGDANRFIGVDVAPKPNCYKPDQYFVQGNSVAPHVVAAVRLKLHKPYSCMVILDSDHHYDHVIKELEIYSQFVTEGQYLIVEDTNLNGRPVRPDYGPGPYEAVQDFLPRHPEFEVDVSREKFGVTTNSGGFLRRK